MIGLLLLIGSWGILFWWVSLFTEALLVPWYCCSLDSLPAVGTWHRVINDFFGGLPGSVLPSLTMVLISVFIFVVRVTQAKNKVWLPAIFFLAYLFLLAADLVVTNLSWGLSNWIVGPRTDGIDAGYHRTWYGILSHLMLWSLFFLTLVKVKISLPRHPAVK